MKTQTSRHFRVSLSKLMLLLSLIAIMTVTFMKCYQYTQRDSRKPALSESYHESDWKSILATDDGLFISYLNDTDSCKYIVSMYYMNRNGKVLHATVDTLWLEKMEVCHE